MTYGEQLKEEPSTDDIISFKVDYKRKLLFQKVPLLLTFDTSLPLRLTS